LVLKTKGVSMLKAILVLILANALISNPAMQIEIINNSLFYNGSSGRIMVKRLKGVQRFQGFALVDKNRIFMAYSTNEAEAGTILSIYDLARKSEKQIIEIGGTGESNFAYNSKNGMVVFNWDKGIYVFELSKITNAPKDSKILSRFEQASYLIKKCSDCYEPKWISDLQIGYVDGEGTKHSLNVSLLPQKE
jgi:hypothetical protein